MISIYIISVIAIVLIGALATWLLSRADDRWQEIQHEFNLEILTLDPVPTEYLQTKRHKHWYAMPVVTCLFLILLAAIALQTNLIIDDMQLTQNIMANKPTISPVFTKSIQAWSNDILRWSKLYNVEPDLIAIVMQIESCGNPKVASPAGAQGLFQVMPFHFAADENMLDPETNARRGISYLAQQLKVADGNEGMAFAAYNGGPSIFNKPYANWPNETQRYYNWATGLLDKEKANETLARWLNAGGSSLCESAEIILNIR